MQWNNIQFHIHVCTNAKITCWAEEEHIWLVQVWVDVIGDCHLGVGKGGELLCVSWTHVTVDVIKKDCKRAAAQSSYLPTRMHTNNSERPQLRGKTLGNLLQFWPRYVEQSLLFKTDAVVIPNLWHHSRLAGCLLFNMNSYWKWKWGYPFDSHILYSQSSWLTKLLLPPPPSPSPTPPTHLI